MLRNSVSVKATLKRVLQGFVEKGIECVST